MMAKGYGLDYVKKQVKKDPKGFYKNLKQMAAAFPEFRNKPKDYKFESVINEKVKFKTAADYFKNLDQSIGLIIRQANNLKGALAKHPIKQNINQLKAVQTMLKRNSKVTTNIYQSRKRKKSWIKFTRSRHNRTKKETTRRKV